MTVTASPNDLPPGTATGTAGTGVGKGQSLLNQIAALQTAYNASVANSVNQRNLAFALNAEQIAAVDYFMATYWVSADQIIATMYPTYFTLPKVGDAFITAQRTKIAARLTQLAAIGTGTPIGTPPGGTTTNGAAQAQYSVAYPLPNSGYPLVTPDVLWYQLNTQLVDYAMRTGNILPASLILSTMTGTQTYPWNGYWSNYTSYQQYWDGQY
jgi:hypothetical protein